MKKCIILYFLFCLFIIPTVAQTGDFRLEEKNSQQRSYEKLNADLSLKGSLFKNIFIGKNYRKEWLDTVNVPVLNLKTDFGGFTPIKESGGKQTHSLNLKDAQGRDWALRSIRKFPEKVIAPELKGTIAEKIIRDGISASYPYSVLSVGTLANAAGVSYFPNTLVYIPDDPALGEFREKFKNTLSFLELRTILPNKETKLLDTEEIIPELLKSADKQVEQREVLKARLLDNFIMDLDRHPGQWSWWEKDSADRAFYFIIPKDRDQAFFRGTGLLPKFMTGKPPLGPLQGFRKNAKNIANFNYSARDFDRRFLSELDEKTWSQEIDLFLASMSDSVIDASLNKQPVEIQEHRAKKIKKTLKEKRAYFKKDMMQYYRFISRTVSVTGSNGSEQITVIKNPDSSTLVQVEKLDSTGAVSFLTYQRLFDAEITKEIRLYGLEGDDKFLVRGVDNGMVIRLIGGPGNDQFINEGIREKVLVYDVSFESNNISGIKGNQNKISRDPLNNEYRWLGATYNTSSLGIFIEYSKDGGFFIGPGYKVIRSGFRKEPYASKHNFYFIRQLKNPFYHVKYDADFMKVGRNLDLFVRTDLKYPTTRTNFFGLGNNSVYDKSNDLEYYKARYILGDLSIMAGNTLSSWLKLKYGPVLQYIKLETKRNDDKYIGEVNPNISNSVNLRNGMLYAGGEVRMEANTKNSEVLPTRGVQASVYSRQLIRMNNNSNHLNQSGAEFSFYTDFLFKNHIVLASAFGLHHNFGQFEFPQAHYLGFKQNMRGYRYQRFAGRTRAYNNSEVRIHFGDLNLYLLKGPFGILGFHDIGRVWIDEEKSDKWHKGYGGGIWFAPFKKAVVTASMTFSEEEKKLPLISLGFQF